MELSSLYTELQKLFPKAFIYQKTKFPAGVRYYNKNTGIFPNSRIVQLKDFNGVGLIILE